MALQRKSNHAKTDDGTMGMGAIKKEDDDDDHRHVHDDCGYCV